MKQPFIVAHRGFSINAIENTLHSFLLAFAENTDFIEGDFWLTIDNEIVCIHDERTDRITENRYKVRITKSSLRDLQKINYYNHKYSQQFSIPTLEDVIRVIPPGKGLFLEIKDNRLRFVDVLKSKLESLKFPQENLRIISYFPYLLRYSKSQIPDIKTYWIFDAFLFHNSCKNNYIINRLIKNLLENNCDGVVLNFEANLNKIFLDILREENLDVCVYGVNDKPTMLKMLELEIDYLETDNIRLYNKIISDLRNSQN